MSGGTPELGIKWTWTTSVDIFKWMSPLCTWDDWWDWVSVRVWPLNSQDETTFSYSLQTECISSVGALSRYSSNVKTLSPAWPQEILVLNCLHNYDQNTGRLWISPWWMEHCVTGFNDEFSRTIRQVCWVLMTMAGKSRQSFILIYQAVIIIDK